MPRTRIKICGLRDIESALVGAEAGADALGFVFAAGSPRLIGPDLAAEIAAYLPPFVSKVALMVDPSIAEIREVGASFAFDFVQLHGEESPEFVAECFQTIGVPILKAIRFDPERIRSDLDRWAEVAEIDALLIDGSTGGQGRVFEWDQLAPLVEEFPHPIILAGGLTSANVAEAIDALRPFAVDVSSGVERLRGVKDHTLIWEFCEAVRSADVSQTNGD